MGLLSKTWGGGGTNHMEVAHFYFYELLAPVQSQRLSMQNQNYPPLREATVM